MNLTKKIAVVDKGTKRSGAARKTAPKYRVPKYANSDDADDHDDFLPFAASSVRPRRALDADSDSESDYDYDYEDEEAAERCLTRMVAHMRDEIAQANAACVIQSSWRRAIACPDYELCRRRLEREFRALAEE